MLGIDVQMCMSCTYLDSLGIGYHLTCCRATQGIKVSIAVMQLLRCPRSQQSL